MKPLTATALLLIAGAITPGPNNLLMLRIGLESGVRAALAPSAGVVLGGLAMLLATHAGVAALFAAYSWMRPTIVIAGTTFVAWLGLRMIRDSLTAARAPQASAGRNATGMAQALLLQFVNPKSWVLVLTITAAGTGGTARVPLATLVLLFVVIPCGCLALWATGGALAASLLQHRRARAWFERTVAMLLLISAMFFLRQL